MITQIKKRFKKLIKAGVTASPLSAHEIVAILEHIEKLEKIVTCTHLDTTKIVDDNVTQEQCRTCGRIMWVGKSLIND